MENEIRKDYLLERWVIVAAERAKRPSDFKVSPSPRDAGKVCPFCPGNEEMTPPATLLYFESGGKVLRGRDLEGSRRSDWTVRCFPNRYPAVKLEAEEVKTVNDRLLHRTRAYGFHEVVVESPIHDEQPSNMHLKQLKYSLMAQIERATAFYKNPSIRYVQIFRNYRREAGASLSHPHSQIIAVEHVPRILREEVEASERYMEREGRCIFCDIIDLEKEGARLIYESRYFVALAPWASIQPFEFWILPKNHSARLLEITGQELEDLSRILNTCLRGLSEALGDPPYNYVFHTAPKYPGEIDEFYHWHLEVYPKLAVWAGFEIGTGTYINVVPPEAAAEALKSAVEKYS
ncbi:galactose-1-phosphate uridylyltransferase [Candidatus Bathyarchaeota archaeon]|nr:galactose-1-phosphate uridylyltransferase [Candidatus Bathyarchaeota archaeon]